MPTMYYDCGILRLISQQRKIGHLPGQVQVVVAVAAHQFPPAPGTGVSDLSTGHCIQLVRQIPVYPIPVPGIAQQRSSMLVPGIAQHVCSMPVQGFA
eukprot:3698029-Rhodomonas_salina.1